MSDLCIYVHIYVEEGLHQHIECYQLINWKWIPWRFCADIHSLLILPLCVLSCKHDIHIRRISVYACSLPFSQSKFIHWHDYRILYSTLYHFIIHCAWIEWLFPSSLISMAENLFSLDKVEWFRKIKTTWQCSKCCQTTNHCWVSVSCWSW